MISGEVLELFPMNSWRKSRVAAVAILEKPRNLLGNLLENSGNFFMEILDRFCINTGGNFRNNYGVIPREILDKFRGKFCRDSTTNSKEITGDLLKELLWNWRVHE